MGSADAVKILVGRGRKCRVYNVVPVPQEGDDETEYATRKVLRFLEFLEYESEVLKSDQEIALGKVLKNARHTRVTILKRCSNSPLSMTQGVMVSLKSALERKINVKVPHHWCVVAWFVEHAINLLTFLKIGKDGKTPFQRLRSKKLRAQLVECGAYVSFLPADYAKQGQMEP